ncbi:MAG: addiction module protein [Nitrospirae bacterium GWC2_46_6]|nr:MAG: addiction module protein [Nitrospirae bacterium GWC2_46_6]OGW21871.1 MAG: addiction module protein [Nitrospirae bacterium GWA2_46_11]OGW25152.1 MAG: addiction module protein [Nitrospirae bacterium GWB2_47_37]HAK89568.1 addiction module protein [Nitrospiraceae bacterium]HCL81693.1 addiction module protein [Nitrospiraceae bacterium]
MEKIKVTEYLKDGVSAFGEWFNRLDSHAAAKVSTALYRLEQGNFSNVKSVGKGVSEYKIDFGPGYRIYFGQEGDYLIILLGGGSKKNQNKDIKTAQMLWAQYKIDRESKKRR